MKATQFIRSAVYRRFVVCFLLLTAAGSTFAQQDDAHLTDILFSKLSGDAIQINFVTDELVSRPGSFSTDKPARIALDFFGVKKQLAQNVIDISAGKVDSVVAVETPDRTRVIVNLFSSARYEVAEVSDGYSITVFNDDNRVAAVVKPKPFAKKPDIVSDTRVSNIDFRRSEAGGGVLIVDLSNDKASVNARDRDGDIIVDISGANLPSELERQLDVTDFATPVQSVDSFQNADDVRIVVVPQGKHQHLSFQSGNRFTLTIDPIVETEEELANQEDLALGYSGERLSINFQKIGVREALTIIADFTGINFVSSDSVQGEITINLKDVPWDQALDVILNAKGLTQRRKGNVIWVAPLKEVTDAEETALLTKALLEEKAPLVSEVIQINYALASDLADVIKEVAENAGREEGGTLNSTNRKIQLSNLKDKDVNSLLTSRGSVSADDRTNSLLVQDVASKIKELRGVIAQLDKPVRQVLIETRIVQANDTFSRELGARLGFQRITQQAQFPGANGSDIGTVFGGGSLNGNAELTESFNEALEDGSTLEFPADLAVDLGAAGIDGDRAASYAFDIFRSGAGFNELITLELSALEADGRGKVVASPRLVTANQREASISQGTELFVSVSGGLAGTSSLEVIEAELDLTVTPRITPDDRIVMDVSISQDNLITGTQAVATQQIETQILADNGETVVIGGVYQEDNSEGVTKVPFLGDIPVIRHLFRRKSVRSNRTELLIFLTPKIISPKLNLG